MFSRTKDVSDYLYLIIIIIIYFNKEINYLQAE